MNRLVVQPLGPGSRCARPGHESGARTTHATSAARAKRTVGLIPIHDVKQRSVVRSRGALLRPGLCVSSQVPSILRPPASPRGFGASGRRDSSDSVPPMRGDGAPTGALFLSVAPAKRDPLSRGDRDLSRRSTVAVFGCGPTKPAPGSGTPEPQRLPASSVKAWRSGSGPPCGAVRAASAGRHSWLRLAGSFLENAPSEPGCKSIYYKLST